MRKRQFLNLNEGDCIYIYSGGKLEGTGRLAGQGRYVCIVEDKNESFLCWRKHNGNEVFTNLNGISVETMNENTAYLENTKDTCERGYTDSHNQNTSSTYDQGYNDTYNQKTSDSYDQNYNDTYQPSYDNSNQNSSSTSDDTYNQSCGCNVNPGYDTYDQEYDNYNNDYKYNGNYNQNSGCKCKQGYNNNYPK
ncbi:hypothetical protein [Bacillus mycoides]|uniref:hypothetical protein n=1 Tax=Bacillus mycoides TaxID=1405 RepID=UPI002079DD5B|nr:hypothetical protein [Bacillus mycoides]